MTFSTSGTNSVIGSCAPKGGCNYPLNYQINSPYCQPYNSYNVSSENLVLDQLIIPKLIFFFILITYLVHIALRM